MPIYEYECEACHHSFERRQHFHEEHISVCPECQSKARRVIHSVPVFFKGSGWYVTDYGGNRDGPSPSSSPEKPASAKPAKPETKAEAKSEAVKSPSPAKAPEKSS